MYNINFFISYFKRYLNHTSNESEFNEYIITQTTAETVQSTNTNGKTVTKNMANILMNVAKIPEPGKAKANWSEVIKYVAKLAKNVASITITIFGTPNLLNPL